MILGALCVRTYRRVFDIFRFLLDVYISVQSTLLCPRVQLGICLTETRFPYIDLALAIASKLKENWCRTPMHDFLPFRLRRNLTLYFQILYLCRSLWRFYLHHRGIRLGL